MFFYRCTGTLQDPAITGSVTDRTVWAPKMSRQCFGTQLIVVYRIWYKSMQWKDKDSILKRLRNRIAVTATSWFNGGRNRRSFRPVMYMICEHKYVRMSDVHDM